MERLTNRKRLLLGVTAVLLAAGPVGTTSFINKADAAVAITAVSRVVKPISLNSTSYINLVDATLSPVDDGQIAAFTINVYNGGSSTLDLSDYWFRLTSASGSSYSLKTTASSSSVTSVASKSTALITLYSKVGESVNLADLIFKVVKFDFNVAGYEKGVGSFTLPKNYSNEVAVGSYKTSYYSNTTVNSRIASATVGSSGDNNYVTVNFVYSNAGKKAITLANYKYYIVTSGGVMYEATSSEEANLVLDPLEKKEFQLTAAIPSTLKTTGWKLLVVRNDGTESSTTPITVGAYQIGFSNSTTTTSSDTFSYANSEGKYQFNLVQVLRQPWDSQDIITARVRIQNKSSDSLVLPTVSGYFYLDDKVKLDYKVVGTTNQFALNPDGYVDVDIYAKLPSNYSFTKATVVVNNTVDEVTTKIGSLTSRSTSYTLPVYRADQSLAISREGSKMTGSINSVNVYNSTTTKVFAVQMTLQSNELRTIDPTRLVGIFKNNNGDIFPATAVIGTGQVNASNKALVTFKANVPQNYDTNNLQLIVGEGVTDKDYSSSTTTPDAYVNAVSFGLPLEQSTNSTYKDVDILPYKFTINTLTPTVLGNDIQLTLDYDLIKDTTYNVYPADRKLSLVVEALDANTGTTYTYFSQDLTLEGDSTTTLKAGEDNELVIRNASEYNGIDGSLKYSLKLYEIVDGAKKLVADRAIDFWYLDNEWNTNTAASN